MRRIKKHRYKTKKLIYKFRKFFRIKHYSITSMNEEEKYIFFLILKMIKKEGTKILIRPISDVIHIQSEDETYYFVIGPNKIKFTKNKYLVDIVICEEFFNKIKDLIFNKIEKERQIIEDKIFVSKLKILHEISKDLDK